MFQNTLTEGGNPGPKISLIRRTQEDAVASEPAVSEGEHEILCQEDAARLLDVSTRYLRDSGCPKLLLQGNGPQGKHLVRYVRSEVLDWAKNQRGRN
jgi:hypothetical protein